MPAYEYHAIRAEADEEKSFVGGVVRAKSRHEAKAKLREHGLKATMLKKSRGVMSFLNDPVQHTDHIHRAIEMADAMRTGMRELRKEWLKREIDLGFGVGIGTGYATLGRIGTRELFHYAAIGSVANLSARLCDEAKDGQILVPQRVYSDIEGDFEVESVGALNLKGFPKPVRAYNIIAPVRGRKAASS